MKRILLVVAVAILYVLHQDIWFWRSSRLVFGFIPIGLFYHACFSVAAALLMWLLVTFAWPSHLRSEEHTSELQSQSNLVCRLLLEKKKKNKKKIKIHKN